MTCNREKLLREVILRIAEVDPVLVWQAASDLVDAELRARLEEMVEKDIEDMLD